MELVQDILLFLAFLKSITATSEIYALDCYQSLQSLFPHEDKDRFQVRCPPCQAKNCYVFGTTYYTPKSILCCAGIHDGKINSTCSTMEVIVHNDRRRDFRRSTRHGVRSNNYYLPVSRYYSLVDISNVRESTTIASVGLEALHDQLTDDESVVKKKKIQADLFPTTPVKEVAQNKETSTQALTTTTKTQTITVINAHRKTIPVNREGDAEVNQGSDNEALVDDTFIKEEEEPTIFSLTNQDLAPFLISIILGSIAVLGVVVLFLVKRNNGFQRRCRRSQAGKLKTDEECVCYVAANSSVQGLLNDPETCERPCHVRETKRQEQILACQHDCGDCYTTKYEF